jgi:DNA helicase-2/ATP-dependent DNA helicase PcrA
MMDQEALLIELDPEQREAVQSTRGPVCVLAGAGTGKTRVITHRIAYAIATGVTDQSKTLALTFTARAAGEMRTRLRTLGVANAAARTFHSAALKQLMYFWPYSLGGQFPKLITTKVGVLAEAMEGAHTPLAPGALTLREISGEIEWAKAMQTAPADYAQAALTSNRSLRIPNGRPDKDNFFEIAKVYQAYETLKIQERMIDFEDILLLTVGMLEEDRAVRERVRDQYRYFTVDEYQDVSPLQQRLLNLWLGDRQDICVVGDPAQTIYSFAGATSDFLLGFKGRFENAQVIRLTRGYRSTPEIIEIANQVLKSGTSHSDHQLTSMNKRGEKLVVTPFTNSHAEVSGVVDEILALTSPSSKGSRNADVLNNVAILARTNSQLDPFEAALKSRSIELQLKSAERFFDRVDVRDAMRVIRSASVLPGDEGDWMTDLRSALRPFGSTDYVRAFTTLAEELRANGAKDLRTFLRELEDRAEQNNPPTLPGVVLSTLHAAKGLEWDHVFLIGINDGILPMGEGSEAIEEERRLFYVGLTRARRTLRLSYSGQASEFLTALPTAP